MEKIDFNIIQIILTSSVISSIVSAIISYFLTSKIKNIEYKNEYYKLIVQKRIEAYNSIDKALLSFKNVSIDETDGKPYHNILTIDREKFVEFYFFFANVLDFSLWIEDDSIKIITEFNQILYTISNQLKDADENTKISVAKNYYDEISMLKFKLYESIKKDMHKLYNLNNIFKKEDHKKISFKF